MTCSARTHVQISSNFKQAIESRPSDVIDYRSQLIHSVSDEKRNRLVIEELRLLRVLRSDGDGRQGAGSGSGADLAQ